MLRRRASVTTGFLVSLCIIGSLTSTAFGQSKANKAIETLHPAKPAVLCVWDGLAAHQKSWDATAAKKALVDSGFSAQINKLLTFAAAEVREPAAAMAHKLYLQVLDKGASLSVTVTEMDGTHTGQFTLIFHGSASLEKELTKVLLAGPFTHLESKVEMVKGRKVTRVPLREFGRAEVGWWVDGGHLVIAGGIQGIEAALDVAQGKTANLSTNPAVKKLRMSEEFEVAFIGMVDAKSLLDLIREAPLTPLIDLMTGRPALRDEVEREPPKKGRDDIKIDRKAPEKTRESFKTETKTLEKAAEAPKEESKEPEKAEETKSDSESTRDEPKCQVSTDDDAPTVGDVLKIAGIDRLNLITARWGFKGEAIWSEANIEAPAPFTGLLAVFEQEPITLAEMPAIPANCDQFALMRLDGSKLYDALKKSLQEGFDKFAPEGAQSLDELLTRANSEIGLDLQADLFDPLGDTIAFYMEGGVITPTATLLIKLDDAEKIRQSLETLESQASKPIQEETRGVVQFRTKEVAGGRTIHYTQMGPQALFGLAWSVDGDWLVVSTTPQTVEAYFKRVDGKLPKWTPPADLTAAQETLPAKFVSLTYSDPRGGMQTLLGWAPTMISLFEDETKRYRRYSEVYRKIDRPSTKPAYSEDPNERARIEQREREERQARMERQAQLEREIANSPFAFPILPEDVPLVTDVTGPLFPNIGVCTVDSDGIHWHSRISIPSLPIPAPGGNGKVE